jgi:hypothetical protein
MSRSQTTVSAILGGILILIGILFIVGQVTDLFQWSYSWPLLIVSAGALFFIGMVLGGKDAGGLAIPGSIIMTVGLILLVQNYTGWWETWSYAWGLIIVGVGVGEVIHGAWSENAALRRQGWNSIQNGFGLFIIFGAIMETIFSLTGVANRLGTRVWPILLIAVGLWMLARRLIRVFRDPAKHRHEDLFWPVIFIGVGAIGLLLAYNVLQSYRLALLVNFWPLLLVALGIHLIFRRSAWVGGLLAAVLVAFAILFGMSTIGANLPDFSGWFTMPGIIQIGDVPIRERVTGNNELASEVRAVSDYDKVIVRGTGALEIVQDGKEALEISADSNLLPYITAEVSGKTLVISVKPGVSINPRQPISYRLSVDDLTKVKVEGASDVTAAKLEVADLELEGAGLGNFTIGTLSADSLDVVISGTGKVTVAGKVQDVNINIEGAGGFEGANLEAINVQVKVDGVGNATVWAVSRLEVEVNGASTISYYGSPSVNKDVSGAGSVRSLGDK